jgi:transcriptional regulator with XRE-family HTH domain
MAKRARRKSEVTEEDVRRGARIRNRREELGLSQPGLAKLLDISQSTIWNIEAGKTLKSRHYHDILRALGLPPEPSPILALPPPPKPPAAATMTPNFLIPAPSAATELVRVFEITFHQFTHAAETPAFMPGRSRALLLFRELERRYSEAAERANAPRLLDRPSAPTDKRPTT